LRETHITHFRNNISLWDEPGKGNHVVKQENAVEVLQTNSGNHSGRMSRRQLAQSSLGLGLGAAATVVLSRGNLAGAAQIDGAPLTLTIWLGGEPGTVNTYTDIFAEYQQVHPNITIEATFVGSDLFNPSLLPALNAGNGPDVWMGGTGPGQPAAIIGAGLAADLTSYYCSLGWNAVLPESVVETTSSAGKLWAVGDSSETTVMYYNRNTFAQNNLTVPTTWAEFITVCDTLKAAGNKTVIGLGGGDKWPISHWQTLLWGRYAGPEGVNNVLFGEGRWDDEPFIQATTTLKDLNDAGYFGPQPLAVFQDAMIAQFWRGEIPMVFTGTWVVGDAARDIGEGIANYGVFPVPSPADGTPIYASEDIGQGWYINAALEQKDVAADLINFMLFRQESRDALLASGDDVPVGPLDLAAAQLPQLLKEALTILETSRANGSIHAFLDTVTPSGMTDITYDGLQALLAGQMSPEEVNGAIQAAWEEAKANDEQLKPGGQLSCPAS